MLHRSVIHLIGRGGTGVLLVALHSVRGRSRSRRFTGRRSRAGLLLSLGRGGSRSGSGSRLGLGLFVSSGGRVRLGARSSGGSGARSRLRLGVGRSRARTTTRVRTGTGARAGTGVATVVRVVNQLQLATVHLLAVQLLHAVLEVVAVREADQSLVLLVSVGVGKGDVAVLAAHVLQILPGNVGRKVFDDHPVTSLRGRTIAEMLGLTRSVPPSATHISSVVSSSSSVLIRTRSATRELEHHALARQLLAVQVVDCIVRVAARETHDESESVLEHDIAQASVAAEEVLHVALGRTRRQPTDVHTIGHGESDSSPSGRA
ncbi:hypothetical protein PFISCL1PPCAC_3639 [Pristionchus fissidentatus]|uniref:Secreted protein n=1 Tax=Pristionchus fissidentatus TaxID=1538716 RepID=A0AAV5V1Y4_9BILA|nr:hypothetical protein PFISCL1PPCAC_3639 [Pristionchus fissidentatus]